MRRVKVSFEGQMVEGEEVDFTVAKEDWNVYECEDGTKLRVKVIAQRITRLLDRKTPDGEPVYAVASSNVVVAQVGPHLMMEGR